MSQIMITCSRCKVSQNESEFYRNHRNKNGYNYSCKKCKTAYDQSPKGRARQKKHRQSPKRKEYQKKYRQSPENKEKIKQYHEKYRQSPKYIEWHKRYNNSPECKAYHKKYSQSPKSRESQKKYRNSPEYRAYLAQRKMNDPIGHRAGHVLCTLRDKSVKNNIPFDITKQDLIDMQNKSDTCPCCFEPFDFNLNGKNPHSPSVDRVIPELGYVPGNVEMICYECNRRKNSSSIEQIERIIRYMKKYEVAEQC